MGAHFLLLFSILAVLAIVEPAHARPESDRTTFLLSRAADGAFPNGPSRNGAVSHDQRIGRYMAYESDASNVVADDANGLTDVFLVKRAEPWGANGTPWNIGATELVSRGLGGQPANGRSYRPALDGDSHHKPHCLAFISEASNLVPGDTNGRADAFIKDLRSGRIRRVSVDSRGRQANGATTEVAIDGACERVAFVSDATNLALRRSPKLAWRTAVTSQAPAGRRQVYVRVLGGQGHDRGFTGLTFLASASRGGRAGNGDSFDVSFARAGKALAFTSRATNLAPRDRNASPDIYRRSFTRKFQHLGHGRGLQTFVFRTDLVSAGGNGASRHPSITDDGRFVAYETLATDLLSGDGNGVSDIVRTDLLRRRHEWVSRAFTGIGNGPSNRPEISGAGEFVLFDSEASNFKPSDSVRDDSNGVRDVFLWNAPTRNVSLESRDSENGYLGSPSQAPVTSSRGNYVPFESANPLIDLPLVQQVAPTLLVLPPLALLGAIPQLVDPDEILGGGAPGVPDLPGLARAAGAGARMAAMPALQQVYVRYLGPK